MERFVGLVEGRMSDADADRTLRTRIDAIDGQLVSLLNERAACALAVGRLKELAGLAIYQPAREADVLRARAGRQRRAAR